MDSSSSASMSSQPVSNPAVLIPQTAAVIFSQSPSGSMNLPPPPSFHVPSPSPSLSPSFQAQHQSDATTFYRPTVTISQCVTLKLTDNNYLLWKLQFEQFLSSQMLLGFVTGEIPRPTPTLVVHNNGQATEISNPEFVRWIQSDQLVMAWLFGSLSETALKSVYGLRSSQEVWFSLAKKYNRVSATRKLDLQKKIHSTTKVGKTMAVYLAEIKSLCDQLDSIGAPLSEHEKISGALTGLGKEYESISTVIEESMESYPGPCFEDVEFKLTNFDDKIQQYESATGVTPHLAFYSDKPGYSSSQSNNNRGGYHNRGGYSGNNRGRGQSRGGNRGGRGSGSYSTRGRGFQQQFSTGSPSDNRPTCQICGKFGHSAYKCYHCFEEDYYNTEIAQALNAMRVSDQEYAAGEDAVIVGNGDFLPITHVGSTTLQGSADTTAPHEREQTQ